MLSNRLHPYTSFPLQKPFTASSFRFGHKASLWMGRGKVELKRIQDKTSRQVSFSKRRNGLMKKSHELSVLCDVDLALLVFSARGRLYEFSNGERMGKILTRYENHKNVEEFISTSVHEKLVPKYRDVHTADELTETIHWHLKGHNIEKLDISGLNQLEQQLHTFLQQVRIRKAQLMMGVVKALQEQEMRLEKERNLMMGEIMAARMNVINNDGGDALPPQLPVMDLQFI